jgi:hypothetical protein
MKEFMDNLVILVGEEVPVRYDSPPGDFRMGLLERLGHSPRSFPNDLENPLQGKLCDSIFKITRVIPPLRQLNRKTGMLQHIP